MVLIKKLDKLSRENLESINRGYTSHERYRVLKTETPERTLISIELEPLESPYIKRWTSDEDELHRYQEIAAQGTSLGALEGECLVGIGLAEVQRWNQTLWVWEFHVSENYRRQGIGRRLMDSLTEVARAEGMRILRCETQNTNVPAIRFYRSVGFEMDGIDLSFYTNTDVQDGEVAIFMKRKL